MNQIDWDAIGTAIAEFLENIDWDTLLAKWGTLMGQFIDAKLRAVDLSGALDVVWRSWPVLPKVCGINSRNPAACWGG